MSKKLSIEESELLLQKIRENKERLKKEKEEILNKVYKKLKILNKNEKAILSPIKKQERDERAKILIELGASIFGEHYKIAYKKFKEDPININYQLLQKAIRKAMKDYGWFEEN